MSAEPTLIIADGFEHLLARIVPLIRAADPAAPLHLLCTSTFAEGEPHNVTDVEDEVRELGGALDRIIVIRKRGEILSALRRSARAFGRYRRVWVSAHGDRQWVLLAGCWLAGIVPWRSRYAVLDPSTSRSERVPARRMVGRLLRRCATRRMLNLLFSRISLALRLRRVLGWPDSLIVEPVGACNLHCRSCVTGVGELKRQTRRLDPAQFRGVMDRLGPYLRWLDISGYGEPLLHPQILEMIGYAKGKGIPVVQIDTNANVPWRVDQLRAFVRSGVDNVIISLDGLTQEIYVQNRVGGDIELVKRFVAELVEAKRLEGSLKPVVVVQMILMRQNEHQVEAFKQAAKAMGADNYRLKHFWLNRPIEAQELTTLLPVAEEHRDFAVDDGAIINKRPPNTNYCRLLWDEMFLASDGTVMPCCFDPNATLNMGNLLKADSPGQIWNGQAYRKLRRQMVTDKSQITTCSTCVMWTVPK